MKIIVFLKHTLSNYGNCAFEIQALNLIVQTVFDLT